MSQATVRAAVVGAAGRMGSLSCRALLEADGVDLVAAVDRPEAVGESAGGVAGAVEIVGTLEALAASGAQVALDFTADPAAALQTARFCAEHEMSLVIGTSGFGPREVAQLEVIFPPVGSACLVVPNFAIGAVLMMRFAELASPWFDTAEIVELHHDRKVDAPSGTAIATAARMGAARAKAGRGAFAPDPTEKDNLPGARGAQPPEGPRIHSVRLRGLVAHQEVLLGGEGEGLIIRHDSYDRASFMPGVVLAVRSVSALSGVAVGLDHLLGI